MRNVVGFEWDEMYVFEVGSFTEPEIVGKIMGVPYNRFPISDWGFGAAQWYSKTIYLKKKSIVFEETWNERNSNGILLNYSVEDTIRAGSWSY